MTQEQEPLRRNTDPHFAGIRQLKARHAVQIADFERWAKAGDWEQFHAAHYDWWTFPIGRPSSYRLAWTVYEGDIAELNADPEFVRRYLRGQELVAASWGWDLHKADYLPDPAPGQSWHHWPVRLHKAALSSQEFGYEAVFASLKKYALALMHEGEVFEFGGHDLSWLFTGAPDPWNEARR